MSGTIDMRMLEEAGLTLEQWRAVDEFFRHNAGNLLGGLLPLAEQAELVGTEAVCESARMTRQRYNEIVEALRKRTMITTGDTGKHGEEEENGDHELHELHEEGNGE